MCDLCFNCEQKEICSKYKIEQKVEQARKELKQKGTKPEIIEYMLGTYRENLYDELIN